MERIKTAALAACSSEHRGGVRFLGPVRRRYSLRMTIENLDGVNMAALCSAVSPAVVFLRHASPGDAGVSSRVDVYLPHGTAMHLYLACRALYAAAIGCAALAGFIVFQRVN